ncbi:hypothetical protein MAPG_07506 [Magnaporthiopsis poae ATCC 64411]|uniref:alpha-1,2-Mannosidase n=1 Tax=Magnaporthiopsis poae (strain ATCC 64411 / 73-15) TaxID=644358 RepID=A0A0C4E4V3_MAGP6|nr:hypothetical protein MAPG_07506 [Magnaporthiopsis poae ATCC 64411]
MPAHVSPGALRLLLLLLLASWAGVGAAMRPAKVASLRREVVDMFYHGYDNYMEVAFPEDELRPIACTPLTRDPLQQNNFQLNDVLGNYSLTLVDSLSTLAILASAPPEDGDVGPKALRDFQDGVLAMVQYYGDGTDGPSGQGLRARGFDVDSKVQVFETVIRGVGGLLSAHLFATGDLPITGYHPRPAANGRRPEPWANGLVYDGQLLRLAYDLASRLLPAFYTQTGMPYPRVNLRHGIPFYVNSPLHDSSRADTPPDAEGDAEITETCSAGAGSLVLEFTVLSRLTGDPKFEQLAKRAFWAVWYRRSDIGLIGAGVDAEHGKWIGAMSVIGAGADSFFEYALKTHILLSGHAMPNTSAAAASKAGSAKRQQHYQLDPNELFPPLTDEENSPDSFLEAWHQAHAATKRHLYTQRGHPHYLSVNIWTGSLASQWIDSLGAFYSGLLTLAGELEEAIETNLLYAAVWTKYAALPERWSTRDKTVESGLGWWPLRPEFIESTYYLYRATNDPWYLYVGEMVLRDVNRRCRTPCGYAGLQNVIDGERSDRMESFFLGETAQYLYLLFDDRHPLNSLDAAFVFTTEGHPLIIPKTPAAATPPPPPAERKHSAPPPPDDDSFRDTCPVLLRAMPLSGSLTAAREDMYHAARMAELHLIPNTRRAAAQSKAAEKQGAGRSDLEANHTLFPWTLPRSLLPENGTCAQVSEPQELMLEFASSGSQQHGNIGSAFNFMMGSQNLERLAVDKIRVLSISSLKLTLRLVLQDDSDRATAAAATTATAAQREWRVTKVNGLPLGRDEALVMDRAILGEVSDPRFNMVRDPVVVKLHHLHRVDLDYNGTTADEAAAGTITLQPGSAEDGLQFEIWLEACIWRRQTTPSRLDMLFHLAMLCHFRFIISWKPLHIISYHGSEVKAAACAGYRIPLGQYQPDQLLPFSRFGPADFKRSFLNSFSSSAPSLVGQERFRDGVTPFTDANCTCSSRSRVIGLLEQGDNGHVAKLFLALERGDLEEEEVADQLPAQLVDKLAGRRSRSAYIVLKWIG